MLTTESELTTQMFRVNHTKISPVHYENIYIFMHGPLRQLGGWPWFQVRVEFMSIPHASFLRNP